MDNKIKTEEKKALKKPKRKGLLSSKYWNRERKLLLLLSLLLVAVVCIFVVWRTIAGHGGYRFDNSARSGSISPTSHEIPEDSIEPGKFRISMNSEVVFENSSGKGSLGFENIPANLYNARVIIRKESDDVVIYESKGIKPGQYIDMIRLGQQLPSGDYSCIAQIIATDPSTLKDVGQVQVKLKIVIKN